jgi:hypothetical protein
MMMMMAIIKFISWLGLFSLFGYGVPDKDGRCPVVLPDYSLVRQRQIDAEKLILPLFSFLLLFFI